MGGESEDWLCNVGVGGKKGWLERRVVGRGVVKLEGENWEGS